MYSSYSTLQRKQLTKQVYTDTQSTYLLVYAPGRHQALIVERQNVTQTSPRNCEADLEYP